MKLDKVLIPLDGSRFAEAALPKAVELIRNNPNATLILLRAAEATTFPGVDPTAAQVSVVHEAEDYLETVAARLREDGVHGVRRRSGTAPRRRRSSRPPGWRIRT
jgi:nucleotide-binding universal stress UspA family protein